MKNKPGMSVPEAANRLGASESSVRNWIDTGRLKGGKTPGGWRYANPRDVERLRRELEGDQTRTDLTIRVRKEDGSMWADVDEVPGAHATGDTLQEIGAGLDKAIEKVNREE